ncbi:radical SAM protein [Holophaga foetida]|uniref:radical SAM protein n=1 Tax=Holophaga foetida TaxID=35839 RepID=UPI0002475044|nr:radical SAM protein [Holophaga foetida]
MIPGRVYGPVPSRRLGRSLGVDLVPWKTCTYDCIYCQLGSTTCRTLGRRTHARADEVLPELEHALTHGPRPDFISLAGSGEPTLDLELGPILQGIKKLTTIPVAVLTNGSLLHLPAVREALEPADVVLPSLDAGDEEAFHRINRPHPGLAFGAILEGLGRFTAHFPGEVWLEVMLVAGQNDGQDELRRIAHLAGSIGPARIQLNTVERPAAVEGVEALPVEALQAALALFPGGSEVIAGTPSPVQDAALSTDPESALVELLGRRPCRAADASLGLGIAPLEVLKYLHRLQAAGQIESLHLHGDLYYRAARG